MHETQMPVNNNLQANPYFALVSSPVRNSRGAGPDRQTTSALAFLPPQTPGLPAVINTFETRGVTFSLLDDANQVFLAVFADLRNSYCFSLFSDLF